MASLFGFFTSGSRALRVACDAGGPVLVPDAQRLAPAQQFARVWTIAAAAGAASSASSADGSHPLTKLAIETPGLAVVRVVPALRADAVAARVVVSSDAAAHVERVAVAVKHKSELRVTFKPTASGEPAPLGALLVEIELAGAGGVHELKATGGGDVVVVADRGAARVLATGDDATVSLVALDHGRLFVQDDADDYNAAGGIDDADPTVVKHLRVAAVSGGAVFLSRPRTPLVAREQLICMVMGDGRVALRTPRVEAREFVVAAVGARGHAQIAGAVAGVAAAKAELVALGGGSVLVQTAPQLEREAPTWCDRLKIEMNGPGVVDAAALAARDVRVAAKGGSRVVVQARERLDMLCVDTSSTVECVGGLPPRVDPAPTHIPLDMLAATLHENRVWTVSEPVPDVPTPQAAFAAPRVLQVKKAGFRETLRPLWASFTGAHHGQSQVQGMAASAADAGATAAPAWVSVMEDVAGPSPRGKAL